MSVTEFNTWERALHFRVHHGGLPDGILRDRTLEMVYVDRARQFDHIEWKLDNMDGLLTRPEYLALGLVITMKLGYVDGYFPWKAFIINRLKGGVGVFGREDPAVGDNERTIVYHGRNRNAKGGKPSRSTSRTAKPRPKKPGKIYPPTQELLNLEMGLDSGRVKTLPGGTTSDVVRTIASRNGFERSYAMVQETDDKIDGLVIPQNMSDSEFLAKLAAKFGYIYKIEGSVLHWHSPTWRGAETEVVEKLVYGQGPDILKVDIDADFRLPMPKRVKASSYDFLNRVVNIGDLDFSRVTKALNIGMSFNKGLIDDPIRGQQLSRDESGITTGSFGTASKRAQARFLKRHWNAFQINLEVTGNPKLLAGKLLELGGTGSPLVDGKWYIDEARHTMRLEDYITRVKLKHPPLKASGSSVVTAIQNPKFDRGTKKLHAGVLYHKGLVVRLNR